MISATKTHQDKKKATPKSAAHPGPGTHQAVDRGQLLAAPLTLASTDLLKTQSELGNGVVQRVLDGVEYEPMSGSANQVSKATRGGRTVGFFKRDTSEARSENAVFSSIADQVLGTKALSRDTFETHSGAELGMSDPEMREQSFGGAFSPLVAGTTGKSSLFKDTPIADEKSVRVLQGRKLKGNTSSKKWVGDTPYDWKSDVYHRQDYLKPEIQRGLANIHTIDSIMGQQDRHSGNLAFDDTGSGKVSGFDNDFLFDRTIFESPTNVFAGLRKDTRFKSLRKPEKGLLEKKVTFEQRLANWKAGRDSKRTEALKKMDEYGGNKFQGLPSHMDQETVASLLSTKSSQFLKKIQEADPENYRRFSRDPHLLESIRNRYSAMRRYVKAGAAAHKPGMLTPEQLTKYGTKEYQETVTKGTGGYLPHIVDHWDAQTYNEQVGALREKPQMGGWNRNLSSRSYLGKMVHEYNNAFDEESKRGTSSPVRAAGREYGKMPTRIDPANPISAIPGAGITQTAEEEEATRLGGAFGAYAPESIPTPTEPPMPPPPTYAAPIPPVLPEEVATPPLPLTESPPIPSLTPSWSRAQGAVTHSGPQIGRRRPQTQFMDPAQIQAAFGQFGQQAAPTAPALQRHDGKFNLFASAEPDHRRSEVVNQAGELPRQVSAAIQKQRGGGVGLPGPVQAEARQILGHDFSDVRIHAGAEANRLSRSIQARAFTIGKDIFFKQGLYTPGSTAGRETLLHELTHVAQQAGSNNNGPLRLGAKDSAHEKQAEQISKGSPTSTAPTTASQAGAVQRSYLDEKLSALGGKAKTLARKGKKWGLGKARSLGKEYLNHFFG